MVKSSISYGKHESIIYGQMKQSYGKHESIIYGQN